MTYEQLSNFSNTWGLVFLIIMFATAIAYAFWPSNKKKFEEAAQLPFEEGDRQS
ncbi:MAG: CcoQ/FixQ family Cbb3-type cytochrome c oxidase assembly chaperone [Rhodobiaceae bacterium]|nr:MAG: CcoQ/FixQ family Cbb3-type cytochrome c oxidase assembly chaperone [Rhodobiaceae bacterium]